MIQVKEFVDTDSRLAEKSANEFLATLDEQQVVEVCYGSMIKQNPNQLSSQRSSILVVYRTTKV
ncbi:sporulation protein Cse60 [Paenibacillus pinihumi]|uniref:sporulation protein Cse60 n=1 Tax=Paenibacillus pinihumi TaxID=669462 RepID=UPI0004163B48|nr:sporulation protein Cse60 [Paenibacillus pinihumi]